MPDSADRTVHRFFGKLKYPVALCDGARRIVRGAGLALCSSSTLLSSPSLESVLIFLSLANVNAVFRALKLIAERGPGGDRKKKNSQVFFSVTFFTLGSRLF